MRCYTAAVTRFTLLALMAVGCNPGPGPDPMATVEKTLPQARVVKPELLPGPEPARLYVVLGGDVMLQDQINTIARERGGGDLAAGYAWFLEPLAGVLDDLRGRGEVRFVVNLESPVATPRRAPRSYPPLFNGPPEALIGLAMAGVDVVTVANNHALDQGRAGLEETLAMARASGLRVTGGGLTDDDAATPVVLGKDVRVAVLSFYLRPGQKGEPDLGPRIAILDEDALSRVTAARASADAVVVTVHWVGEFVSEPKKEWESWAHRLVGAGADAVICHGPHVPGPVEVVETPDGRQAPVAYSLGNLLSNMGWEVYPGKPLTAGKDSAQRPEARQEVLAVLEFTAGGAPQALTGFAMIPMWLMDNRYASFREGAGPRLIYPLPMPGCVVPDPAPCFAASRPDECDALSEMLENGCEQALFTLFERRPLLVSMAQ